MIPRLKILPPRMTKSGVLSALIPMPDRLSVSLGVWIRVGSRNESKKQMGISHFIEHLAFKGTKSRDHLSIKRQVEGVGANLNAFTSEECTCFLVKTPRHKFAQVFEVLSDIVQRPTFEPDQMERERAVILEEIKMTQDSPSNIADENLSALLWPKHALGRSIAGTDQSVKGINRNMITDFHRHHYHSANMFIVAAGGVDPETFFNHSQKLFSQASKGVCERVLPFAGKDNSRLATSYHSKKTEQTQICIGFSGPGKGHRLEYAIDLMSVIMGGNMSSRLFNEVREKRGLAYDIGSYHRKYKETGAFIVGAGTAHEKARECVKIVLEQMHLIAGDLVGRDELQRAKDYVIGQSLIGLESTTQCMLMAGDGILTNNKIKDPYALLDKIKKITPEDIQDAAKLLIHNTKPHLSLVGPKNAPLQKWLNHIQNKHI